MSWAEKPREKWSTHPGYLTLGEIRASSLEEETSKYELEGPKELIRRRKEF